MRKSESWAAPPIKKRGDSESNQPGANRRVAGIRYDRAEYDVGRGKDENNHRGRIGRNAKTGYWTLVSFAIDEQRRCRQSEEDPIPERHVIDKLPERPRQRQSHRERGKRDDGSGGRLVGGMQDGEATEEHAIGGHSLQYSRRHQNHEIQKAEGRQHDPGGYDFAAGRTEDRLHRVGRGRGARRQPRMPKDTEIGEVRQEVHRDDDRHAEDQGAREVALRLDDLFGNEVGLLPAAVGEKDWDERRPQGGEMRRRRRGEWRRKGREKDSRANENG